jgi:putative spermidine/putrescine transport system ATP-binding protein
MDALEIVHMQHLADRRITALSGGQRQRVALARAVVFEPRLLLMDEPLSALDKNLREHMQIELKRLHKKLGMTTIYVTHDQQEALTMSDRIAVLDKGRIIQLDVPATVYDRPNCKFVAGFMGETRFLPVERRDQSYVLDGRPLRFADTRALTSTGEAWLMVRPERLRWQGDADRDNRIEGRVLDVVYRGDCNQVSVSLPGGHEVAIRHAGAEQQPLPQPGDTLALWLPADASLVIGSAAP